MTAGSNYVVKITPRSPRRDSGKDLNSSVVVTRPLSQPHELSRDTRQPAVLVRTAAGLGYRSIALTDHGSTSCNHIRTFSTMRFTPRLVAAAQCVPREKGVWNLEEQMWFPMAFPQPMLTRYKLGEFFFPLEC